MRRPVFISVLFGIPSLFLVAGLAILLLPARVMPPLSFAPVSYGELAGWQDDSQAGALGAFLRSCTVFSRQSPTKRLATVAPAGNIGDWLPLCDLATEITPGDDEAARNFFEDFFQT